MNLDNKKILLIRLSSIGDIVLTTPVIRCIKKQCTDTEIHYLIKKNYKSILEANPYIDRFHLFDTDLSEIIPQLKKEKFDLIIDLHRNIRSILVIISLHKKFITFNKLNIKKWIYVNFHINLLPDMHIVDRYFKAIEKTGVVNDGAGLDFFISKENEININNLPETYHKGYIAFVIGGKQNTKKFPSHKIIEVCKKLSKPVILLGGKEDYDTGQLIVKEVENDVYNSCGKYDIAVSASIVKHADKVITNDTGLMHIAAAFHKPILSLWGNTVPEFGMYPYIKDTKYSKIMEVKGLSCRPCSKLGFKSCPHHHFKCMELISVDEIVDWCNKNNTSIE